MKYKPHGYQKKAIRFMIERSHAGLFLDPGLGKTSAAYGALLILKKMDMADRTLVITPLRPARSVWPREAKKWDDFSHLRVQVLHGGKKDDLLAARADVDVINPEGLPWLFGALKGARNWPWQMLIIDESTRFKNTNSQRFKNLKPHLTKFLRRYILTGSPAPNGLLDLFGQVFILDLGYSLGQYVTHYRRQFFDSTGYGGYTYEPKGDAEEKIYKRLRPLVLRMEAKDYIKLPPLINNTVEVELPDKARRIYDAMEELFITAVEDGMVTAANVASASGKCRQIANGGVYKDADGFAQIHDAKTEAAAEIVEELSGKPALIAYEFKHDLARLKKVFGKDTPHLGGGVTAREQTRIEDAWNAGDLPVLLAQPQSVAHGLNLQGTGAAIIWHSLTWNLEDYEQFVRRIWRQGQKSKVVVHHIVAKDTIDEAILRRLGEKDRAQRALLSALKEYVRKRNA